MLRSGVWSAGRAGKVQKLIVILLAVIVVLIAPWTLAVLFAGVLAYGIWLAVVGLITAIFVAGTCTAKVAGSARFRRSSTRRINGIDLRG